MPKEEPTMIWEGEELLSLLLQACLARKILVGKGIAEQCANKSM
jgi:hypothetical protein